MEGDHCGRERRSWCIYQKHSRVDKTCDDGVMTMEGVAVTVEEMVVMGNMKKLMENKVRVMEEVVVVIVMKAKMEVLVM